MSRQAQRSALLVFLVTAGLGGVAAAWVAHKVLTYPDQATGTAHGTVEIEIPRGAGAGEVASRLAAAGLLDRPTLFRLYAGQRGLAGRFKAGHYVVDAPASPRQLIDLLVKGTADELITLTIPEGRNVIEVAELFDAAGITPKADFLNRALSPAFARELGLGSPSLEGYLYPDTYKMRPGTPATRTLAALVRHHRAVFDELKRRHAATMGPLALKLGFSDSQFVTLASIVEKETGRPEERPRIAQVFVNRLLFPTFRPHLLQTDPTIVYGCTVAPLVTGHASTACRAWDGRIRRIQLDDLDNSYSTYAHEGLPPGPIANPGRAALEAVMRPDGTRYLYFVARNDGTHQFSVTRAEHEAAVVKFQRAGKPLGPP